MEGDISVSVAEVCKANPGELMLFNRVVYTDIFSTSAIVPNNGGSFRIQALVEGDVDPVLRVISDGECALRQFLLANAEQIMQKRGSADIVACGRCGKVIDVQGVMPEADKDYR